MLEHLANFYYYILLGKFKKNLWVFGLDNFWNDNLLSGCFCHHLSDLGMKLKKGKTSRFTLAL